jgi:hypothetical protein
LSHLWWLIRYRSNKRKARLYTVAYCHDIWHLLVADAWRHAVEVSELFSDKLASREELIQARNEATAADPDSYADLFATRGLDPGAASYAYRAAVRTAFKRPDPNDVARLVQKAAGEQTDLSDRQRHLYLDLAGPSFFRTPPIECALLRWNNGTIVKLAKGIYDDRAFERLPILADALEEAGCDNADILYHCRGRGPHVRGCWVVDLLLGKE